MSHHEQQRDTTQQFNFADPQPPPALNNPRSTGRQTNCVSRLANLVTTVFLGLALVFGLLILFAQQALPATAAPLAVGPTLVTQTITAPETWTTADSPYIISGTINVQAQLTIEPGVVVSFTQNSQLVVQPAGQLLANGTSSQHIQFTSNPGTCYWEGIRLESDGNQIQYASFEYAAQAIKLEDSNAHTLQFNTFQNNGGCTPQPNPLSGAIIGFSDNSVIDSNVFTSNHTAIYLTRSGGNSIAGNVISGTTVNGIYFPPNPSTPSQDNSIISNTIRYAGEYGLFLARGIDNSILGNVVHNNNSGGIRLENQTLSLGGDFLVQSNDIYSNTGPGLYITQTVGISLSDNLIWDNDAGVLWDLNNNGAPAGYQLTNNIVCQNPDYLFRNNDTLFSVPATPNWWGTNTPTFGAVGSGSDIEGDVTIDPRMIFTATTPITSLPADGVSSTVITISLESSGETVPARARMVNLSTSLGTLSANQVTLDANGVATVTLQSASTTGTAVVTAVEFCGYPVTTEVEFLATDVEVSKSTTITQVVPGQTVTYTVAYSNNTSVAATGVVITDTLPTGLQWESDDAVGQGFSRTLSGQDVVWSRPSLGGNVTGTITLVARMPQTATASCGQNLTNSVAITTATVENNTGNNSDSAGGVSVICADVGVNKTTTLTDVALGQTITYTLSYSNAGTAAADNVVITDTLPPGTSYVSDTSGLPVVTGTNTITWPVGSLGSGGAGSSFELVLSTGGASCGDALANQVSISTTTPESGTGNNSASASSINVTCADVTLNKVAPASIIAGTTVTYTIYYTNAGTAPAANVVITDVHPITGGVDTLLSGASLNPGQSGSVDYPVFVDLSICGATPTTPITNTAYISSDTADSDAGNNSSTVVSSVLCGPDLVITKTLASSAPSLGKPITFTIEYENAGVITAPNAVITDFLPADVTYLTDTFTTPPVTTTNTVVWSLGDLSPGDSGSFEVSFRFDVASCTGSTSFINQVDIASDRPDTDSSNNSDLATSGAIPCDVDLVVVKNDGVGGPSQRPFVLAGDLITYTVTYLNAGGEPASGVVLTETLPAYTTFEGPTGPDGWFQVGASALYTYNIGALPAKNGDKLNFVVRVVSTLPTTVTLVDNLIEVDGNESDAVPGDNSSFEQTPVQAAADLRVEKSSLTPVVNPGGQATYAITVTNQGTLSTTNVLITDTLPASTTYVTNTAIGAPVSTTPTSVVWNVGQLDPAQTVSFNLTLQADSGSGICADTHLMNTVEARGSAAEGDTTNNIATTTSLNSPVVACRDLVITKTVQSVAPSFGKVTTFTVTYQNAGIDPMNNVVITDFLDSNVEYITDTLGGAVTSTGTVAWSLGNLAPGANGSFEVGVRPLACLGSSVAFTNAVRIGSTTSEPYLPNNYNETGPVSIPCGEVDLVVVKNDGVGGPGQPSVVFAGELITYTISYLNAGDADASGVVLTETLPTYTTFVGPTGPDGWFQVGASALYTYNIGTLPSKNGDKLNFVVRVVSTLPSTVTHVDNLIEIGGNESDAFPADDSSSEQTPVQAAPDLVVEKVALTAAARPNQPVTYAITVTNQGNGSAHNVVLTDTLPANTSYISDTLPFGVNGGGSGPVSWNITTLLPGGSRSFELTLQADANICNNLSVVNTIEAVADEPDANPADNTATATSAVGCRDVSISKSVDMPQTGLDRDIVFTLSYSNPGIVTATNTLITDVLPSGITFVQSNPVHSGPFGGAYQWNVGDVSPGITGTIVITGHVDNDPALCDQVLTNTTGITASFTGGDDQFLGNNQAAAATTVRCIPDLVIGKNDRVGGPSEPPFVQAGDVFTYSILYSNIGVGAANGVVITETLPNHTTFVGPTGPNGWFQVGATREYTYNVGTVNPGAGFQVEFAVQVEDPLTLVGNFITNTVCIGSTGQEITLANNCSFEQTSAQSNAPRLDVTKSAIPNSGSQVQPGQTVTYTVVVLNNGQATANNVLVTDTLPLAEVSFVTATLSNGTPVGGPNPLTVGVPTLAVNDSVTMTVVVNVNSVISGTVITNTAQAVADTLPVQLSNPVTHTVGAAPILNITKLSAPVSGSDVDPGDPIVYFIHIRNNGNVTATNLTITDTLPISTEFVLEQLVPPDGTVSGPDPLVVNIPSLAGSGSTMVFRFVVTVTNSAPNGLIIPNQAQFSSDQTALSNTNVVTHIVGVAPPPPTSTLAITKTADPPAGSTIAAGSTVTYTITVTNTGATTQTNISVFDILDSNTTLVFSATNPAGSVFGTNPVFASWPSLAAGDSVSLVLGVDVADPLPDGTVIANSATASSSEAAMVASGAVTHVIASPVVTPSLVITKAAVPVSGSPVEPGDFITYTVTVANNGANPATNVIISDTLDSNVTLVSSNTTTGTISSLNPVQVTGFDLAAGQSMTMTLGVTVTGNVSGTVINNRASVTSTESATLQVSNLVTHVISSTVAPGPNLLVTKSAVPVSGSGVVTGTTINYTVSVLNNGTTTANNVVITDTLPLAEVSFVTATVSNGSPVSGPNPLTAGVGNLAAGNAVTMSIEVTVDDVPPGTIITNTAQATADTLPLQSSLPVTHQVVASTTQLLAGKSASPPGGASVIPGQVITYSVVARNAGSTPLTNVVITDSLPLAQTSFVTVTMSDGSPVTGPNPLVANIVNIPANSAVTMTVAVTVNTIPQNVTVVIGNRSDISSDQTTITSTNLVTHLVTTRLAATKSASPAGGSTVQPDSLITYTIRVQNMDTTPATGVVITDSLPVSTTLVSSSTTQGSIAGPDPLVFNVGTLNPGQTANITFTVRVQSSAPAGLTITNTGRVASNQLTPFNTNQVTHQVAATTTHVYLPIIFKNFSGPSAGLAWVSQNDDEVQEVDGSDPQAFVPDGQNDGAFLLTVDVGSAGTKTVDHVTLESSQGAGVAWDTVINGTPVLGIFNGGTRLNNADGTVTGMVVNGQIIVTIYASDDAGGTRFPPDTYDYTVTVRFTDGTSVTAIARIPPPPPPPPPPACDVVADITVGNMPRGVAVDETRNRVYVANYGSSSVSVVDTNSNTVLQTLSPITTANGIVHDPARNIIWVSNYSSNQVTPIQANTDATSFTVLPPVSVRGGPWGVAYVNNYVYVVNSSDNTVTVIDAATRSVETTLAGSFDQPYHVAADPVTGKVYVTNFGNHSVTVLKDEAIVGTVNLNVGDPSTQPYGVAIDETRGLVYVATVDSHRVVVIDIQTDQLLGWAAFHRGFNDPSRPVPLRVIAINPDIGPISPIDDGGHVWMTTSTADGSEANQALMSPKGWSGYFHSPIPCDVGTNPAEGIAINRSLDRAYITSGTNPGSLRVVNDNPSPPLVPFSLDENGIGFDLHIVK